MALGSNQMTTTTGNVFRPDIWSKEASYAFKANLVIADKVTRYDQDAATKGKTVPIPKISNLVANDKVANVEVTLQAPAETSATITINQHKEASFIVEDILEAQSSYNLLSAYTEQAAYACKRAVDTSLAGLATGFSGSAGTYNTTLTVAFMNTAVQTLDDSDVPREDRCWVLKPHAVNDLYTLGDYMRFDGTGYAGGYASGGIGNGMKPQMGYVGMLYGAPVYVTSQIAQSGNNISNMYFHKSAIGLAIQKQLRTQAQYQQQHLGWLFTADVLYGFIEIRNEAGLELKN